MDRLFNMDNPVMRALGRLADLMILNILFIITCLPIVTIGAAITGMYYVTLKMAEHEESYIARSYWKSFRQNFKQATGIWLIYLVFAIVLVLDLLILKDATGVWITTFRVAIIALCIIYLCSFIYVFPTLARFDNTVKNTIKNSFIMAIADFPRTVVMLLIVVGSVVVTLLTNYTLWYGLLVWLMAGFALVALANSYFLKKVFAKYMPEPEPETEDPDFWDVDKTLPETEEQKAERIRKEQEALAQKQKEKEERAALEAEEQEALAEELAQLAKQEAGGPSSEQEESSET